jgi:hypothetical protein
MSWRLAAALGGNPKQGLLGEINAAAPGRSVVRDGGIGDQRHAKTASDHNPCACCGVVCARDFTHDPAGGFDAHAFAEWLRLRVAAGQEPRVKYVISNRRIFSGEGQTHPVGVWRKYGGKNPHAHHVHVSVRHEVADDLGPWGWPPPRPPEAS